MKIIKSNAIIPPAFQPIKLEFLIETQEDYEVIRALGYCSETCAKTAYEGTPTYVAQAKRSNISRFLHALWVTL